MSLLLQGRHHVLGLVRKDSGTFGVPDQILRDSGAEFFKIHKTGTVLGKPGRMRFL